MSRELTRAPQCCVIKTFSKITKYITSIFCIFGFKDSSDNAIFVDRVVLVWSD